MSKRYVTVQVGEVELEFKVDMDGGQLDDVISIDTKASMHDVLYALFDAGYLNNLLDEVEVEALAQMADEREDRESRNDT